MDIDLARLDALRNSFDRLQAESAGLRQRIEVLQDRRDKAAARLGVLQRSPRLERFEPPLPEVEIRWATLAENADPRPAAEAARLAHSPVLPARAPPLPEVLAEAERDLAAMDRTLADLTEAQGRAFARWTSIGRLVERCEQWIIQQHRLAA